MKCLLCNRKNNKIEELKDHYVKYHNVDENNLFFKKSMKRKKTRRMWFIVESVIIVTSLFF